MTAHPLCFSGGWWAIPGYWQAGVFLAGRCVHHLRKQQEQQHRVKLGVTNSIRLDFKFKADSSSRSIWSKSIHDFRKVVKKPRI
jgi:hypothetical protein